MAVVAAILVSVAQKIHPPTPLTTVRGVIGSEKLPFFQDPAVIQTFRDDALLANGRFLEDRFGGSALKLPAAG